MKQHTGHGTGTGLPQDLDSRDRLAPPADSQSPVRVREPLIVPTLDAIARDPAKAAALPAEDRGALIVRAAAVLAALGATMTTARDDDEPDTLLTVAATAQRLEHGEHTSPQRSQITFTATHEIFRFSCSR